MIDPRFANAGAASLVPGYGAQQVPAQYHNHHRHHRHHKHKVRNDESPVSLDESIHKVDNSQPHHFQQTDGAPLNTGYGVPYGAAGYETGASYGAAGFGAGATGFGAGATGFGAGATGFGTGATGFGAGATGFGTGTNGFGTGYNGFYPQQQQYGATTFGYANQYQGVPYGQGQFVGGPVGQSVKNHRRHHRHHRHQNAEAANTSAGIDQAQAVPEQLIGQRSSSVLNNEQQQHHQEGRSSEAAAEGEISGEKVSRHRHNRRHHHHHQSGEQTSFGHTHQSRQTLYHTTAGADGYGHINDDLIFIERGDHSPHRQEPPPGYEYKGKIEVQNIDREHHIHTTGQGLVVPPSVASQTIAPPPTVGPCPPGWQQMVLTSGGSFGPCPPGGIPYTGQLVGGAGVAQSGAGSFGVGGGFVNFGAGGALPPNCHFVADYNFGSSSGGVISSGGTGLTEQVQKQQVEEHVSGRATIIEVWQKRAKSEIRERSEHRTQISTEGPSFDFERFRTEILAAVERAIARGGPTEVQWTGRDGGTQTQIHPSAGGEFQKETERRQESAGEVRVIVQPIQPVFYMPRQTGETTAHQIGPVPVVQQQSSAPNVIYVPRNVYVPVIKPVFVPRERVIVRPQVIHVARPVLVDRPVPVTQRPIIIDRERPIPVPVRGGGQGAAQSGGSKVVREEYVYRDNLPVAYGGRCAEFSGGVNYGYMPTQQEHQYANSSTHETGSIYQTQGHAVNVNVPHQFQHSQTSSHVEAQQGGAGSCHGSYSNLAEGNNITGVNVGQFNQEVLRQTFEQSAQIGGVSANYQTQVEVLDTAVNPHWQKTDQPTLMRRYGRPAFEIVEQSKEVEQQMYNEIRQRTSSGGVVRSASTASYASGSGIGIVDGGIAQY